MIYTVISKLRFYFTKTACIIVKAEASYYHSMVFLDVEDYPGVFKRPSDLNSGVDAIDVTTKYEEFCKKIIFYLIFLILTSAVCCRKMP